MKRRLLLAAAAAMAPPGAAPAAPARRLQVWRDPDCGCCGGWVEHMRAAGFRVEEQLVASPAPARRMLGIPADLLGRVFEPFVQLDSRLTRVSDGVGLGLAISRDLAHGMGGDLVADSEVGVGSRFTLTLPAAEDTPVSA